MFTLFLIFAILVVIGAVGILSASPVLDKTVFRVSSVIFMIGMLGCGLLWIPVFAGPPT